MEQIGARVSLKEARRAVRDAKDVSGAVRGMGDAADRTSREFARTTAASRAMLSTTRSLAIGLGSVAAAATGAAVLVGTKSVQASSDLGEQVNKVSVVFRGHERDVLRWSQTLGDAFGQSRREALQAAGVYGNMLVPMGFTRGKAADMSKALVELTSDMASFNNAAPQDIADALRSGLSGETEPLRQYGVFLNDVRIKQEAHRLGLKKVKGEYSASAKAQAAYNLIMRDTVDAQGDFKRTQDSLPNLQRRIKANTEDLSAAFGKGLEPGVRTVTEALNELVVDLKPAVRKIGEATSEILFTSNDLSPTEKARRLFDISKAELSPVLGPIVEDVAAEFGEMDLGSKLGDAIEAGAPRMADAMAAQVPHMMSRFASAFAEAGPGGRLLTVGLIAAKLGAFRGAGALAGGWFSTAFAGGVAAGTPAGVAAGAAYGTVVGKATGSAAGTAAAAEMARRASLGLAPAAPATAGLLATAGGIGGLMGTTIGAALLAPLVVELDRGLDSIYDQIKNEGPDILKPGATVADWLKDQPTMGTIPNPFYNPAEDSGLRQAVENKRRRDRQRANTPTPASPSTRTGRITPEGPLALPTRSAMGLPDQGDRLTIDGELVIKLENGKEIHRQGVEVEARRKRRR